jgi:hypothetical protein
MADGAPKTLAEMAAEAEASGGASNQWSCHRCGGKRWWVCNSYFVQSDGSRHRKRECRTCHSILYTREIPTGSNGG